MCRPRPGTACARRASRHGPAPRAADQDQRGKRSLPLGFGQCPGQGHSPGLVLVADLNHLVRKRSFGRLRPAHLGDLVGLLQGQRKAVTRLGPCANGLGACLVQLPLILRQRRLHLEGQHRLVEGDRIDPHTLATLVEAVQCGHELTLGRLANVYHEPQAQTRSKTQLSFPGLLRPRNLRHGGRRFRLAERQGKLGTPLRPRADGLCPFAVELALVLRPLGFQFKRQPMLGGRERERVELESPLALVGAVQRGDRGALVIPPDVQYHAQFDPGSNLEAPFPVLCLVGRIGRGVRLRRRFRVIRSTSAQTDSTAQNDADHRNHASLPSQTAHHDSPAVPHGPLTINTDGGKRRIHDGQPSSRSSR